jgi:hypothetical protein
LIVAEKYFAASVTVVLDHFGGVISGSLGVAAMNREVVRSVGAVSS